MKEAMNGVLPASSGERQMRLVQSLAATDIQASFRGYRWRSRWRSHQDLTGSVRELAASTLQAVVRAFLRARNGGARKPWRQAQVVQEMAATSVQSAFRAFRVRCMQRQQQLPQRKHHEKGDEGEDCTAATLSSSSTQTSLRSDGEVDRTLSPTQQERDTAAPEEETRPEEEATSSAYPILSPPLRSPLIPSPPRDTFIDGSDDDDDDALSLARAMNSVGLPPCPQLEEVETGAMRQQPQQHQEERESEGEEEEDVDMLPPPALTIDTTTCGGRHDGDEPCSTREREEATTSMTPVMTAGGEHREDARGWMTTTATATGRRKRAVRTVLLVKMARERRHAVQASYKHACEVVSRGITLRDGEVRIVLQGIGVLPPPFPSSPSPAAAATEGGNVLLFHVPLTSTAEAAEALRAACVRLGLGSATAREVTNKKAELARKQLLKMIKGAESAYRLLVDHSTSTTGREWHEEHVLRLLEALEVPTAAREELQASGRLRDGMGKQLLLLSRQQDGGLASLLGIKQSILQKRLELFQLALQGIDTWETKGLWPGSTPLMRPLPLTRLAAANTTTTTDAVVDGEGRRGLSKSLGSVPRRYSGGGNSDNDDDEERSSPCRKRSSTLPLPLPTNLTTPPRQQHQQAATPGRLSTSAAAPSPFDSTATITTALAMAAPSPVIMPPPSTTTAAEGLTRMNLATIKKGAYLLVASMEEVSRIFRAAWRANGLDDVQGGSSTLPTTTTTVDAMVADLEGKGVGGRYGRIVCTQASIPSYSFVKVEVYRPIDPLASLWLLTDGGEQDDGAHDQHHHHHHDIVDLPLRALFHVPAGLAKPFAIQPQVLRLGRRVQVADADRLRACLDSQASTWIDSESTYTDILSLAGQHAEVICLREARGPLQRVGIRTAIGLEDAVPLAAIEPLALEHPPHHHHASGAASKRRRTVSTTSTNRSAAASTPHHTTPQQPGLFLVQHANNRYQQRRRRHSLAGSTTTPTTISGSAFTSPFTPHHNHTATPHHRRTSSLPSPATTGTMHNKATPLPPPKKQHDHHHHHSHHHQEDAVQAPSANSPPGSPPPLAFPDIPARLSRLGPQPPPRVLYPPDHRSAVEQEAAALRDDNDDDGDDTRQPAAAPVSVMAVEVKTREKELAHHMQEPSSHHTPAAPPRPPAVVTTSAEGLDAMLTDKRVRLRSSDRGQTGRAPAVVQHPQAATGHLHKQAMCLSPVKLVFHHPNSSTGTAMMTATATGASPTTTTVTPAGSLHRPAPSLTMNKAPMAVKPRPASATTTAARARRASWAAPGSPPLARKRAGQQQQQQQHRRPRSASSSYAGRSLRQSLAAGWEEDDEDGGEEMTKGRNEAQLHEEVGGKPPKTQNDNDDSNGDDDDSSNTRRWSSRWSKFRGRPIYRPPAPATTTTTTVLDDLTATRVGEQGEVSSRRKRDVSAANHHPRRRHHRPGLRSSLGGASDMVGDLFGPLAEGPETESQELAAEEAAFLEQQQEREARGQPSRHSRHRRGSAAGSGSGSGVWDYTADIGGGKRRSSLEAKLRAIERQSQARMTKIQRVVERLKASPNLMAAGAML